jgi:hypothetical protein
VLNYALALEIFEADIYRQSLNVRVRPACRNAAALGRLVLAGDCARRPGRDGPVVSDTFTFLRNITFNETAHRDFLRTACARWARRSRRPTPAATSSPTAPAPEGRCATSWPACCPSKRTARAPTSEPPAFDHAEPDPDCGHHYSVECRQAALIADTIGRTPGPVRMEFDQQVTDNYPSEDTFEYFRTPVIVLRNVLPPFLRTSTTTA